MPSVSDLVKQLNPEQRAAATHVAGPALVLAGAGSGKTRVITTRIACLTKGGHAAPDQILAVTFTNKAAEEMRERVAGVIGKKAADAVTLSTFHAFCVRVLRAEIERLGYRKNFTISTEGDTRTLVRRALEDMDGVREAFDPGTVLEYIGRQKNGGAPVNVKDARPETDTAAKYRTWLPELFERYQSALRAANTVDFDDLLILALRLWREHPEVLAACQERFRFVMVDEYQDTNRIQYDLLRALTARSRNLFVVGDDDQAIYSWRGADIANILSFEKDFPEAKVVKLEQNYRSTTTILDAANRVISNNTQRRPKNLWSALGEGRKLEWFVTADEEGEAREAIGWMQHIREKSGASFADFAVLYRSNLQSRPFEIALRNARIPYTVTGGQDFFERAEIRDIVAYLRVLVNPRDEPAFLRVVNVPRRGIGDATLHQVHDLCRDTKCSLGKGLAEVLRRGGLPANTEAGIRSFLGLISGFRRRFASEKGLTGLMNELLEAIDYRGDLLRSSKSPAQFEARWGNVTALLDALMDYEETAERPTLAGFLDQTSLDGGDDRRSRDKNRGESVSLMTVHSAKGLEFPFVFIVGMEEGQFPHDRSVREGGLEEERRLFYVALTRGKRHVTLFEAVERERRGKKFMTKTSRFLSEIPQELLKPTVRAARDMVAEHHDPPEVKKKARRPRKAAPKA
jgi:superfamily I DNA/RNA helicase